MEFENIQPLGFLENDIKTAVYNKSDIIRFLKSKHNNENVDEIYNKYWLNNKDIIIVINNENYHYYETQEINEIINSILEQQKIIEKFL